MTVAANIEVNISCHDMKALGVVSGSVNHVTITTQLAQRVLTVAPTNSRQH